MLFSSPICFFSRVIGTLAVCAGVVSAQPGVAQSESGKVPAPPRDTTLPEPLGVAEFDGAMTVSGEISVALERDAVGYSMDGTVCGPEEPRWARKRWMIGDFRPETVAGSGMHRTLAGGFDRDGAIPVVVDFSVTDRRLLIHRGEGQAVGFFQGVADQTHVTVMGTAPFIAPGDLLRGQSNAVPGWNFQPKGACVWKGLVFVACSGYQWADVDGTTDWYATRAALMWTSTDLLETDAEPWRVGGISKGSVAYPGKITVQHWSVSLFPIDEDRAVVLLADYRGGLKDGGYVDAYLVERHGDQQPTITGISLIESQFEGQHAHVAGLIVQPDGSMSVLASFGDAKAANVMLARTLAPAQAWANQTISEGSGIGGVGVLREPSGGWSAAEAVWGGVGPDGGLHNQVVSMVPGDASLGSVLCGGDETSSSVLRLRFDHVTSTPSWEIVYQPQVTSDPSDGSLVFGLQALAPGGPYVGQQTGRSWGRADRMHGRIIWSPDGVDWGQLAWTGADEQVPVVFEGPDAVLVGSIRSGYYKRIELAKEKVLVQPLMISGSSGVNQLAAGDDIRPLSSEPDAVITRVDSSLISSLGVPLPPCHTEQVFRIDHTGLNGRLGVWRPVGDGYPMTRSIAGGLLVRMWIYALPPTMPGGEDRTTRSFSYRLQAKRADGVLVGSKWIYGPQVDEGQWVPITVWLRTSTTNGSDFYTDDPGAHTLLLDARVAQNSDAGNPGNLLVCFESVIMGSPTIAGFGESPGGGTVESLRVDFARQQEWTVYIEGFVPEHHWDFRTGSVGSSHRPPVKLFRVLDDTAEAVLAIEPSVGMLTLRVENMDYSSLPYTTIPVRQSSFRIAMASDGDRTWIRSQHGGFAETRLMTYNGQGADSLRFDQAPVDLLRVSVFDEALSERELASLFDLPLPLPASCPADLDSNGRLDFADLGLFLSGFGAGLPVADLNGDSAVNFLDVSAFLEAFGRGCPGAP